MDSISINERLSVEYEIYYPELLQMFSAELKSSISPPLLMHVYPEYDILNKKLMIVGQETKGWFNNLSKSGASVQKTIQNYKTFELGKNYHNSPFWRFNKGLFKKLNPKNKAHGLLWTNLSKVDQNGKGVNQFVRKTNRSGYELLVKEIDITKPEIIVFLTSWKEDQMLKTLFAGLKFEKIRDLPFEYLVRLKGDKLPYNTFRTYHPRFLNNGKLSKFTINEIIDRVAYFSEVEQQIFNV